MKIELEINNLKTTIDGLNNAILAYMDVRHAIWMMGCVPEGMNPRWEKLIEEQISSPDDMTKKIDERIKELKYIYNQLIKIEQEEENGE